MRDRILDFLALRRPRGQPVEGLAQFVKHCLAARVGGEELGRAHEFAKYGPGGEAGAREAALIQCTEEERRRAVKQRAAVNAAVEAAARKRRVAQQAGLGALFGGLGSPAPPTMHSFARTRVAVSLPTERVVVTRSGAAKSSASLSCRAGGMLASEVRSGPCGPPIVSANRSGAGGMERTLLFNRLVSHLNIPGDVVAGLCAALQDRFGVGRALDLASSDWFADGGPNDRWAIFAGDVQDVLVGVDGGAVMPLLVELGLVQELLFAVCRIAVEQANLDVDVRTTDDEALVELLSSGWELRRGEVWGENDCLADSLLQLLQAHCVIRGDSVDGSLSHVARKAACEENRRRLWGDPLLRPRLLSGRHEYGAFLQHDVHAGPTIEFFLTRFECISDLPSAGVDILVHTRADSYVASVASRRVCGGLTDLPGAALEMHLFNWTGQGFSGYHYDALVRSPSVEAPAQRDAAGGCQREASVPHASGRRLQRWLTDAHDPSDAVQSLSRRIFALDLAGGRDAGMESDELVRAASRAGGGADSMDVDVPDVKPRSHVRKETRPRSSPPVPGSPLLSSPPQKRVSCARSSAPAVPLFPVVSGAGAGDVGGSGASSVPEPRWKRFTPADVDLGAGRCQARTWGEGRGSQCGRQAKEGRLCVAHAKELTLSHGFIDGDIPEGKWVSFVAAAESHQSARGLASRVRRAGLDAGAVVWDSDAGGGASSGDARGQRAKGAARGRGRRGGRK